MYVTTCDNELSIYIYKMHYPLDRFIVMHGLYDNKIMTKPTSLSELIALLMLFMQSICSLLLECIILNFQERQRSQYT